MPCRRAAAAAAGAALALITFGFAALSEHTPWGRRLQGPGYGSSLLIGLGRLCGNKGELLPVEDSEAATCGSVVEGMGSTSFALGKGPARGRCYAMDLEVTSELYDNFQETRHTDPPCPSGHWQNDEAFDMYVLKKSEPRDE